MICAFFRLLLSSLAVTCTVTVSGSPSLIVVADNVAELAVTSGGVLSGVISGIHPTIANTAMMTAVNNIHTDFLDCIFILIPLLSGFQGTPFQIFLECKNPILISLCIIASYLAGSKYIGFLFLPCLLGYYTIFFWFFFITV